MQRHRVAVRLIAALFVGHMPGVPQASAADFSEKPSLFCNFQFGGRYLADRWTPVTLRLTNPGSAALAGDVRFQTGRDNALAVQRSVFVPPRSTVELSCSVRPGTTKTLTGAGEVATAVWQSESGQELTRTALQGERVASTLATAALTVDTLSGTTLRPENDAPTLGSLIESASGSGVLNTSTVNLGDLPRRLVDYDAFGQVLLLAPPDDLDAAQRAALLAFVDRGGTLIVSGAFPAARLEESWLAPLLPVQIVGRRETSGIRPRESGSVISLLRVGPVAETVVDAGDTSGVQVFLEDDNFVHLAARQRGRGRVVFTSFVPTGLDLKNPVAAAAWREALAVDQMQPPADPAVVMAQQQLAVNGLLGRAVPPLSVALLVSGGFVLLLIGLHLTFTGSRRPMAFGISLVFALLAAGGLMGVSAVQTRASGVSGARLTSIRLGPDGRGEQQDLYAFYGPTTPDVSLTASNHNIVAQPLPTGGRATSALSTLPFGVADVGVRPDSNDQIWQALGTVNASLLQCRGAFTDRGLQLTLDNQPDATLQSPLLVWGGALLRLGDVPAGQSTALVRSADLNPPRVYTHGGLLGQVDRLRSELIANLPQFSQKSLGAAVEPPSVLGWFDHSQVKPLLTVGGPTPLLWQGQAMVQARLSLRRPSPGSNILVEGPFNQLAAYKDATAPPTDSTGSAASTGVRDWIVAVKPPAEIGQFRPVRATISLDLDAPQYAVSVQAQQFAQGNTQDRFVPNEQAVPIVAWSHPIGRKTVTIDLTDADRSPEGWLVLRFAVQSPTADASAEPLTARWTIQQLQVTLSGTVTDRTARKGQ